MPPSVIVVDYGNVLTRLQPPEDLERMASLAGLPLDDFLARYWQHRPSYDDGLPVREYWGRVLETEHVSDTLAEALIDTDVRSWMHYREDVWDLTRQFRARGGRTAMLSNGVPEIISRIRLDRPLDAWFDVVVVSCEVGCVKPDRAIYELCLNAVGATPAAALFVDDRLDNIQAADAIGMRTLHFTDDAGVDHLRRILGL